MVYIPKLILYRQFHNSSMRLSHERGGGANSTKQHLFLHCCAANEFPVLNGKKLQTRKKIINSYLLLDIVQFVVSFNVPLS